MKLVNKKGAATRLAGFDDEPDGSDADDEGDAASAFFQAPPRSSTPGLLFDGAPADWAGAIDLEELCQTMLGLPVADAEDEVREALKKVGGEATDADTLAVLLRVFRLARESAVEGYDGWDSPVEYCRRLSELCDKNFLGGGDSARAQDFPANIVASVYAECGRTLFLAGKTSQARDRLEKALHVFSLVRPDGGAETEIRQASACHASMARVLRRLGQCARAQDEYLQALQALAETSDASDVPGLISEYCEVVTEVGEEAVLSPALLELMVALVEDKFGEESGEHMKALRELADACSAIGKPGLAAPMLATLARLLRDQCDSLGNAWAEADAQAAEEEAAQALEAAASASLQEDDLEAACASWSLALSFRELVEEEGSEVLSSMRQSLEALRQAAAMRLVESGDVKEPSAEKEASEPEERPEEPPEERPEEPPEDWAAASDAGKGKGSGSASEKPKTDKPKAKLTQSATVGLRPAWATGSGSQASKPGVQPADDAWDS